MTDLTKSVVRKNANLHQEIDTLQAENKRLKELLKTALVYVKMGLERAKYLAEMGTIREAKQDIDKITQALEGKS